jgi:segregation and condensation protein B
MVPPRLTLVSNNARDRDATAENSDSEAVHDAVACASLSDPEAAVDHLSKSVLREKLRRLEALLFASAEPLDAKALASCLEPEDDVNALLAELQSDYKDRGVVLVRPDAGSSARRKTSHTSSNASRRTSGSSQRRRTRRWRSLPITSP